jgi:hypothetical protein
MAFSDYKSLAQVQEKFQIRYQESKFVTELWTDISITFDVDFDFYRNCSNIDQSDTARRELLILPILKELYQNCGGMKGCPGFWVDRQLEADDNLAGSIAYLFTTPSPLGKTVLGLPILLLVTQAKRNDFEQGWGQCLAELIAADRLNQHSRPVYGVVTDGKLWEFGRLEQKVFTKHLVSYTIADLEELFCLLNGLLDLATQDLVPLMAA